MYQGDVVYSKERKEEMRVYDIYAGNTPEEQASTLLKIKQIIHNDECISEQVEDRVIPYYKVLCTWSDFRKIAFKLDLDLLRLWF